MLLSIRKEAAEAVTAVYAPRSRGVFGAALKDGDYLPVVIPTKQGAEDLPATLASLSFSERPAVPYVGVNSGRGDDRKHAQEAMEVASAFGAVVFEIPPGEGAKIAALQEGLRMSVQSGHRTILVTDDDTLFPRRWSRRMGESLGRFDSSNGGALFGTSLTMHGNSLSADTAYTAYRLARDVALRARGGEISPRGHNYGLQLDDEGEMLAAIEDLNGNIFMREAHGVLKALRNTNASIRHTISPRHAVVTRGDRVGNLREVFGFRAEEKREAAYREQYGEEFTIYTGK